jgi:hypothetical protein
MVAQEARILYANPACADLLDVATPGRTAGHGGAALSLLRGPDYGVASRQ